MLKLFLSVHQHLFDHLMEFENVDKVVSFCSDSIEIPSHVLSWNEFLCLGMENNSESGS